MPYVTQTTLSPLYPELIWNKPETKALAGKLLIIGGNSHSIAAPNEAYRTAINKGAGEVRVVLPDAAKRYFPRTATPDIMFAPSTPSGSFAKEAVTTLLQYAEWADIIYLAGDMSKNSETTMALIDFCTHISTMLVVEGENLDTFIDTPHLLLHRKSTLIVPQFTQLQKIAMNIGVAEPLTATMPLKALVTWLEAFSNDYSASVLLSYNHAVYVACRGQVSITKPIESPPSSQIIAITAAVWAMQQPSQLFKAITTSITQ